MSKEKPYDERVKECVHLLKLLKEQGIRPGHIGYSTLKSHMDAWVKDGTVFSGKIDFIDHSRKAEVLLPMKPNSTATIHLKHHVFEE
jgi:hypothetical protein